MTILEVADRPLGSFDAEMVDLLMAAYEILSDKDGHIIGAHILSDNASGMINTIRMAMIQGTTASELWKQSVMSPYPTKRI